MTEVDAKEAKDSDSSLDMDLISCLLQPLGKTGLCSDTSYVGTRRFLLQKKAMLHPKAISQRNDWRCNGKGYTAYRNYIWGLRTGEQSQLSSGSDTPGNSGRWASSPGLQSFEAESWSSSKDLRVNSSISLRSNITSNMGESNRRFPSVEPAYSFVGMHCIFDSCKSSVTILKFGHRVSNLLAYGASDGSLFVCDVSKVQSMPQQMKGHTKDITDFDFSSNNQYIASSSLDKTIRVWEIAKGHCMRVIYGVSLQLSIRFNPVNNNLVMAGNANKEITAINFSTGRVVNKAQLGNAITAIDNDHTGQFLFSGDDQGFIYTISVNTHTGKLSKTHRHQSSTKTKAPITTIQYRTFSLLVKGSVLLSFAQDGTLSFFSVALEVKGYLTPCCFLKLSPRVHSIRASFCPLLSLEKGEFIVSGSDDSNVYFYDLTRPKHACVNKLQGHSSSVIGVAWNHGENLLASSDSNGTVIVWKRAKTVI